VYHIQNIYIYIGLKASALLFGNDRYRLKVRQKWLFYIFIDKWIQN